MSRSNTTKKALLISIFALLFSMVMMVGSTFAWFTDSVTSGTNTITTGKLDVELSHKGMNNTEETVEKTTLLFTDEKGEPVTWEPGVMTYENFTVKNKGDLALQYRLSLNMGNENTIIETDYSLKDVLKVKVVDGAITDDMLAGFKNGDGFSTVTGDSLYVTGEGQDVLLKPGEKQETKTYGVVIYWQPDEDTDYNYNLENYEADGSGTKTSDNQDKLSVDLGITLAATQAPEETDSFDANYDSGAVYPVSTADELTDALANAESGATIELTGSFFLKENLNINKDITLDGVGGAVISGSTVTVGESNNVTIRNVTFKEPDNENNNASSLYAESFKGKLVLENCTFEDPQLESVQITPLAGADITVKDCTFSVSNQAKHNHDGSGTPTSGAHRWFHIEVTDRNTDIQNIKLTMTDNTFTGGSLGDDYGITIYGIPKSNMDFNGNSVDDAGKLHISDGRSATEFISIDEFTKE